MLLGWAQCARCEQRRGSAIRWLSSLKSTRLSAVSRQPSASAGLRKFAASQERSSPQESPLSARARDSLGNSSLFAIARKPLRLKILTVSLWGSRFCGDFWYCPVLVLFQNLDSVLIRSCCSCLPLLRRIVVPS